MNISINISNINKYPINLFISKHKIYMPKANLDKERFKLLCKIVIKKEIAFIQKLDKDYFDKFANRELKFLFL